MNERVHIIKTKQKEILCFGKFVAAIWDINNRKIFYQHDIIRNSQDYEDNSFTAIIPSNPTKFNPHTIMKWWYEWEHDCIKKADFLKNLPIQIVQGVCSLEKQYNTMIKLWDQKDFGECDNFSLSVLETNKKLIIFQNDIPIIVLKFSNNPGVNLRTPHYSNLKENNTFPMVESIYICSGCLTEDVERLCDDKEIEELKPNSDRLLNVLDGIKKYSANQLLRYLCINLQIAATLHSNSSNHNKQAKLFLINTWNMNQLTDYAQKLSFSADFE
jgi:hypothetical protein